MLHLREPTIETASASARLNSPFTYSTGGASGVGFKGAGYRGSSRVMTLTPRESADANSLSVLKLWRVAAIRWAVFSPMPSTLVSSLTEVPKIWSMVLKRFRRRLKVTGPTPSARISFSHKSISRECLC